MADQSKLGLRLEGLEICHGDRRLVALNHEIAPGEVLTLMGPSGVGKSTLLSAVIGTLSPEFRLLGEIFLNGQIITNLPPHQRNVGILFQETLLFPHMSVGANLAFGLASGGTRAERRERVNLALAKVGLEGFADRDPATLSGGQRARVALMRTLLAKPQALLLDEPFSGLDAALRTKIRKLVFEQARAQNLPVLMVTHDGEDAAAAGGEVITLGG
ncbi:ATP-binding cassette domain-containing protein [Aliiroseovarius lamellibrachiae]|uniref:ATP-binding cassette domain-containing protein n=1 Tax=Aliiroseovarius lamellibrachiae TaxID=1924933 RepID=UPI001BE00D2B|nr:ATP-binding cassette domain-containing protein [Aliiroseovarius lamellibrachiae]MBT2132448.1 ATP-binding cassette domain-containing protein [Aliiroseovarius lamellibrachiae]